MRTARAGKPPGMGCRILQHTVHGDPAGDDRRGRHRTPWARSGKGPETVRKRTGKARHQTETSGLRTETTREELALAAHDGVLQGLIAGRAALKRDAAGFDARNLLVGGGARSEAYRQRLADLLGTSVTVPDDVESVAAGAAVQAAAVESLHRVDQRGRASTDVPELLAEFATRWGLGSGQSIPPRV